MQCRSCGTQLPEKAAYCPTCGALTPYQISESGASPYDLTIPSASSGASPHKPGTDYGSPPYGVPSQNSYVPLSPYEAPLRPPPPPPAKNRWVLGWMVLVVLVGLIVGYVGFRGLVSSHGTQPPMGPSTTAPAPLTPQEIYKQATSGTPVLDDPLSQNSPIYNWTQGTLLVNGTPLGRCTFTEGALHVIANAGDFDNCNPTFSPSNDFAFQVQMTILQGDAGGMQFHINQLGRYVFVIFQRGSYKLFRYQSGSHILTPLRSGFSSAINTGLNQSNLITVVAQANTIDFYVNRQYVTRAVDSTYQAGSLGVSAFSTGNLTEVEFRYAKVWTLP